MLRPGRINFYIETSLDKIDLNTLLLQLKKDEVEVSVASLFQTVLQMRDSLRNSKEAGLFLQRQALYVTDVPQFAGMLAAGGYPVIGYLHEGNRNAEFVGVNYLVEQLEEVDADYLYKIFERYLGEPWHILDTARCTIRETTVADVDEFYRIYADPSITAYMEGLFEDREEEVAYTRDYIEKVYALCGFGMWTITEKQTGEVMGRAGLYLREGYEEPELGFVVALPWQQKGIAYEACHAILEYGREELGFTTIRAFVEPENKVSAHLCEKLGFTWQGQCTEKNTIYDLYLKKP